MSQLGKCAVTTVIAVTNTVNSGAEHLKELGSEFLESGMLKRDLARFSISNEQG